MLKNKEQFLNANGRTNLVAFVHFIDPVFVLQYCWVKDGSIKFVLQCQVEVRACQMAFPISRTPTSAQKTNFSLSHTRALGRRCVTMQSH